MKPVYWIAPLSGCDLCHNQFGDVMFDARVPRAGAWGNICPTCFTFQGCELGTGHGQKYAKQTDGRWLKIAG